MCISWGVTETSLIRRTFAGSRCAVSWSSRAVHCDSRVCSFAGQDIHAQAQCPMLCDVGAEWLWPLVSYWSAVWAGDASARITVPGNDGISNVYRQCVCDIGYDIEPTSSILSSIGGNSEVLMCDRAVLMCDRENSDCPNFHVGKFGLSEFPCWKIRIVRISMFVEIVFTICVAHLMVSCLSCSVRLDFRLQHFPYSARRLHALPCKVSLLLIRLSVIRADHPAPDASFVHAACLHTAS